MQQEKKDNEEIDGDMKIYCRHCHKEIVETNLKGISLICPHCGRPGNGKHMIMQLKKQKDITSTSTKDQ